MNFKLVFVAGAIVLSSLHGAERPTHPGASVDTTLLDGKTVEEFFEQRRENTPCREKLTLLETTWKNSKNLLTKLLNDGAGKREIREQETNMLQARENLLAQIRECGDCAAQPIGKVVVPKAFSSENWYISDGSCYVNQADPDERMKTYEARVQSLREQKSYPYSSDPRIEGGFYNILEFFFVDPATGQKLPTKTMEDPTFTAFISIRGPEIFGQQVAFGYVFENTIKEWEENGVKHFLLTFSAIKPPRAFRMPRISAKSANGDLDPIRHIRLQNVVGQWYVNSDGYSRYFTAADFGMSMDFAKGIALRILTDTVVEFSERGK